MDLSFNTIRRLPRMEPTGQIIVFNLDSRIVDSDVVNLFRRCGPLWSAEVHYDNAGKSLGSADVIFERRNDAIKAIKEYHGLIINGERIIVRFATWGDICNRKTVLSFGDERFRHTVIHFTNTSNERY